MRLPNPPVNLEDASNTAIVEALTSTKSSLAAVLGTAAPQLAEE